MRRAFAMCLILTLGLSRATPGLAMEALEGDWAGALRVPGQQLRLVLHLHRTESGAWKATLDSVDQGAMGLRVDEVVVEGNQLRLELSAIGAEFRGEWHESQGEIQGFWRQSGATLPLTFKRPSRTQALSRPQDPQPPFPYQEEEVQITRAPTGVVLAGTLTSPAPKAAKSPAVLLLSGSGPQDRDGTVAGHRPFRLLADHLTRHGFVVLRTDDRGVGQSSGHWATATLEDLAADASAMVAFLKGREEVDAQRVIVVGHSLGGIVGAMVGREEQVAALVLLAAPALPGQEVLHLQSERLLRAAGAGKKDIAKAREINARAYEIVAKAEHEQPAAEQLRAILREQAHMAPEQMENQVRTLLSPFFRSFLLFDPKQVFPYVKRPLLAIYGDKDLQVPAREHSRALRQLLPKDAAGRQEILVLPRLNHLFQEARKGTPEEYAVIEQTMSPKVLDAISGWLLQNVATSGS